MLKSVSKCHKVGNYLKIPTFCLDRKPKNGKIEVIGKLKKNQQFFILKFNSRRLKNAKYEIDMSFSQARKNGEVISISNSELLRTLFRYKGKAFSQEKLDELIKERKRVKRLSNSEKNKKEISRLTAEIDDILFVEDLVSVEFEHKTHYMEILKRRGFYINGIRFTPFMASAGMIRKNTALFINNNLKHPIMDILENGRDESVPMVAAKFGAYFSLYSSSTLPVSFPRFAVVPDKTIENTRKVSLVTYQGISIDDKVEEVDYPITFNAFDGQGLISPKLAKQWSKELELDYTFSTAIIRAPFLKGTVTVFDLSDFANRVAKNFIFTDFYGNEKDIRDYDLIVSESMFKLANAYKDTEYYIEQCHKNNLGFSVSKVNQNSEKSYSTTSYQFLQVLNLSDAQIAELCEPTLNWLRDISGNSPEAMILYATGETNFEPKDFNKMDAGIKALTINPELANDRYIHNKFVKTISKKKRDSYMGSLLINANYQFMISDPYYQACHIFGLDCQPLLPEGFHYSKYWLDKGIKRVASIRSPIVHHSEMNVLNFLDTEETRYWYKHIKSGIIFPANGIGIDCMIHGGADFDGDLICTINNPIFTRGIIHDYPIMYESKKSEKTIVDSRDDKLSVETQLNGHNSKVGFATNISSSMYTMLEEYLPGSDEWNTIQNRLKIGRAIQGEIIDGVKGLSIPPFREHWTKETKITENMSEEEKQRHSLYNKIICDIRPAYFRFLYSHYMTRYRKEIEKYDTGARIRFNKSLEEIISSQERNEEEQALLDRYKEHSFFLDNNSVVNRISRNMRQKVSLLSKYMRKQSKDFDYKKLLSGKPINKYAICKMKDFVEEYRKFKRNLREGSDVEYENLNAFINYLRDRAFNEISSNEMELADVAIEATYGVNLSNVAFAWEMFGDGIVLNLIEKSDGYLYVPVKDENGDIEYLWNRYTFKYLPIEEIYDIEQDNIRNDLEHSEEYD